MNCQYPASRQKVGQIVHPGKRKKKSIIFFTIVLHINNSNAILFFYCIFSFSKRSNEYDLIGSSGHLCIVGAVDRIHPTLQMKAV